MTHIFTLTIPHVGHDYHEIVCTCGASARTEEYLDVLQQWKKEHLLLVELEKQFDK